MVREETTMKRMITDDFFFRTHISHTALIHNQIIGTTSFLTLLFVEPRRILFFVHIWT